MKAIANILITGCSSQVAKHLIPKLPKDSHLYCLSHTADFNFDRPNITHLRSDLKNSRKTLDVLSQLPKVDCVIHLAGITDAHVSLGKGNYQDNIAMAKTIAAIIHAKHTQRLIFLSSNSVNYGLRQYAQSKLRSEEILKKACPSLTILRPTLIISSHSPEHKSLALFFAKLPFIPLIDRGRNIISPVEASDVASAILLSMNTELSMGRTYTLSGDSRLTISDLTKCLQASLKMNKPTINIPSWLLNIFLRLLEPINPDSASVIRDTFLYSTSPDNSLAKKELGWIPKPITCQTLTTNFR